MAEYDDMYGIAWEWQSIDGNLLKSPLGQDDVGPNPTDRGKKGSKRHLLVDERGVLLSIVVTAANVNDCTQVANALSSLAKPAPEDMQKHLCADAGYYGRKPRQAMEQAGYTLHVKSQREEQEALRDLPNYKARRWVVEAAFSWLNRFRKILVRYEKTLCDFTALNQLAAAIIALRKCGIIYG